MLGEAFSVADILLVSCLTWADFIGIEVGETLAGYRDALTGRPAYQSAWRANFPPAATAAMADQRGSGA